MGVINSKQSELAVDEPVLLLKETHVVPKPLERFQVVCLSDLSLEAVCTCVCVCDRN